MDRQSAHILVVDDEPAIRMTLEVLLRRRGYAVMTAAHGAEALALVEQHVFDLILLDLRMPGMSGLDVARRIANVQPTPWIMLLSGESSLDTEKEDDRLEGFAYISKTNSPQEVLARVEAALAERM